MESEEEELRAVFSKNAAARKIYQTSQATKKQEQPRKEDKPKHSTPEPTDRRGKTLSKKAQAKINVQKPISELKAKDITPEFFRELRKKNQREWRLQKSQEKKHERYVRKMVRQIDKSLAKGAKKHDMELALRKETEFGRLTPPKKNRGWISRLVNRNRYEKGKFDSIEEDIEDGIYQRKIREKKLSKRKWKKIQKYEDARQDIKAKKALPAFKGALVALALVGSLLTCKVMYDKIDNDLKMAAERIDNTAISQEMLEKTVRGRAMRLQDINWLYEYTDGQPTVENWEKLSDDIKQYVRNPVTAAEAESSAGFGQAFMYTMTDGDITDETWEKLPDELKEHIQKPSEAAREAAEEGNDQKYLYYLSRGKLTDEFWQTLPPEVKQYVRNPLELAKAYEQQGDALGYLRELSDYEDTRRLSDEVWSFLPDELKEHIPNPRDIIEIGGVQFTTEPEAEIASQSLEDQGLYNKENGELER